MKICLFDISVRKIFYKFASVLSIIFSFAFVFITIPDEIKTYIAIAFLVFLLLCYILIWIYTNRKRKVTIRIRNTRITIAEGDIFTEPCKKIIPANEYFDTIVDDKVIAKNTLYGQYLLNCVDSVPELNESIVSALGKEPIRSIDEKRKNGKKIAYNLGTIFRNDDYWLLAYSRFDKDNKAYLTNHDFAECYMNMWNEIDKYHAGHSISIPVLGSGGIVRIFDNTPQQLVETILWTFRISGISLGRTARLKIVIHKSMIDEIDFIRLKNYGD